jgi:hypothetical protein
MESAITTRHAQIPRAAFATGAVVVATFAAAVGMWKALPGSAADAPAVVSRPPAHALTLRGTHMAGMDMPGMKMPMPSTARR